MGFVSRSVLALLSLLVAAPSVHAAKCLDQSGFPAAMATVESVVPCRTATKHKKYVKQAKKAIPATIKGACRKQFIKSFLSQSICGRAGFEICCATNKKGGNISKAVKAGKPCKGEVCSETDPQSVGVGCSATGTCLTSTTTSTTSTTSTTQQRSSTTSPAPTTTTTTTSTTTSTLPPGCMPVPGTLEFTLAAPGGPCGDTRDANSTVLKTLSCGGLSIGGGGSIIPEGPTPDGSISRFALTCNTCNSSCTIGADSTPPSGSGPDCTDTGCNFGTPLPIPNPTVPGITVCVQNSWKSPATGTLDMADGSSSTNVPLNSDIYLTGNLAQPCPVCSASGTPASPGAGTCDRGSRAGMACTSTNSNGLTRDCPTGGADDTHTCLPGGVGSCLDGSHVGVIVVDLSPLTTGMATQTNATGQFCPLQLGVGTHPGCFGSTGCRTITENGVKAGAITPGTPANATLASVFCIAATGNGLVDGTSDLPGPGATSLPGLFVVNLNP